MDDIRTSIEENRFPELKKEFYLMTGDTWKREIIQ